MRRLILFAVLFHVACTAQADPYDSVPDEVRTPEFCDELGEHQLAAIAAYRWQSPITEEEFIRAPCRPDVPDWACVMFNRLIHEAYAWGRDPLSWITYSIHNCKEVHT